MRKINWILCLMLGTSFFISLSVKAQVFIVENAMETKLFSDLESAVDAAKDGDNVYVPGGEHSIKGSWKGYDGKSDLKNSLAISKRINLIGEGYQSGGTSSSIINNRIYVLNTASGSTITGLTFSNHLQLDNTSNVHVSRCYFSLSSMYGVIGISGSGENNIITECIIGGAISASSGLSGSPSTKSDIKVYICKNIINSSVSNIQNSSIKNNILKSLNSTSLFDGCSYCNIENNIITRNLSTLSASYSSFKNNLLVYVFTSAGSKYNTFENNIERQDINNIFINYDNGDYHLEPNCLGKNAGTDGTDIGIYGTSFPFKDNRLPAIPYFSLKTIGGETSADKKLKINIQVEAQDY